MKRLLAIAALALLAASAPAQNELKGLVQSGEYRQAPGDGLHQPPGILSSAEDVYAVPPYSLYTPTLAAGAGLDAVHVYCQLCHSNTYITMQPPLPADTWEAEVKKMMETHGAAAAIPEDTAREILDYLKSHYTPETRKK
jgi:hypothetical protein